VTHRKTGRQLADGAREEGAESYGVEKTLSSTNHLILSYMKMSENSFDK
jgi:hypothetical protein